MSKDEVSIMQVSRRKITNLPELDYNGSSLAWVDSYLQVITSE